MKTFKTLVSEVAEPKAGDEKAFKDKHIVTKVGHPVALDHQFTGEIPGTSKSKRRADLEAGEDEKVYEAMDPVNPKAVKKKFDDRKDKDIDNDGDVDSSDEYLHKRRKAISKAMKKEGNAFTKALFAAREAGDKTFIVAGKTYNCEDYDDEGNMAEAPQPKWKVAIGNRHYTVTARNTAEADRKAKMLAKKDGNNGVGGKIEKINEDAWEEIPMMMNSLRSMSHNISGISRYLQATQDPEEWFQNKLAGVAKELQTLYSYATAEVMSMGEEADLEEAKKPTTISRKTINRALQGMKVQPKDKVSLKKAPWDKKEEADQIEEAVKFKTGMMKLKDGSSVILKKQDADLLTQMFKDLSPANRKKMEKVAMEDKAGFEEILGFAREAL